MNRGPLPGFYWDEDKKRYFKIQANHLVPTGVQYSKGSIDQERRIAKKRKVEERNRLRQRHSINPAAHLTSPLGRTGLWREQYGYVRPHHASQQSELAVLSQWIPTRVVVQPDVPERRLRDAHFIAETNTMLCAFTSACQSSTSIYARNWDWEETSNHFSTSYALVAALWGGVSSISTRTTDRGSLVVGSGEKNSRATFFASILSPRDETSTSNSDSDLATDASVYLSLGPREECHDTAIHPEHESAALIGSMGIYLIDTLALRISAKLPAPPDDLDWPACDTGIGWLDRNTLLYGAREGAHSVMLWDVRAPEGKVARFTVRERLTGVFTPPVTSNDCSYNNPHEILAATNHRIHLFDVRMPRSSTAITTPSKSNKTPPTSAVLTIPHLHGGPRLQSAAKNTLVAAVDRDNVIQIYSIRTGKKVTQLTTPPWQPRKLESPLWRKLMWYDDPVAGSVLQAVRGSGVVRWAWREGEDGKGEGDESECD